MTRNIFLPGDVGLVRGTSIISEIILEAEQSPGEPESKFSHCFLCLGGGNEQNAQIIEAMDNGVVVNNIYEYIDPTKDNGQVFVYRSTTITDPDRKRIIDAALKLKKRRYGFLKLLAMGIDRILGTNLLKYVKGEVVCSTVVGIGYKEAGIYFLGKQPFEVQPDDIGDDIERHAAEWELVFHN